MESVGIQTLKVLLTWSDDESSHVQSARRDDVLRIAFSRVAVRTVLPSWDYSKDIITHIAPSEDIHHRLFVRRSIDIRYRANGLNGVVKAQEESSVSLHRLATNEENRTEEVLLQLDAFVFIE